MEKRYFVLQARLWFYFYSQLEELIGKNWVKIPSGERVVEKHVYTNFLFFISKWCIEYIGDTLVDTTFPPQRQYIGYVAKGYL